MIYGRLLILVTPVERLPIPYLNGEIICVSLGDLTTWGSLFNISSSDYNEAIMLAVKVHNVFIVCSLCKERQVPITCTYIFISVQVIVFLGTDMILYLVLPVLLCNGSMIHISLVVG